MNRRRKTALLPLLLFLAFPAVSQEAVLQETEADEKLNDFLLIPILETAFSGNLRWHPDWPIDIPPDGFSLLKENVLPQTIELSNGDQSYTVRRDSEGRLLEFPFFLANGYAKVEISYTAVGAAKDMSVVFFSSETDETGEETEEDPSQEDAAQSEQRLWTVTFPADFLPYSEFSPGGSFPPLTVFQDEDVFNVYFFESPVFLSEAWYNGEGEMLVFCKALIDHEAGGWRVRSLQIYDSEGLRFVDYSFDSGGNITEVQMEGKTFSAIYRGSRPVFWRLADLRYELQWDTQGILTIIKAAGETLGLVSEYRYEYERDADGNWLERQETAYGDIFGVLARYPPGSRGTWSRRIVLFEQGEW
jgi:hypothetical protein